MYCPYCGQQPPTEQTRYCTHCGFALSTLKEFLSAGTLPGGTRQRDITLGAGLMLIGAIKSFLLLISFNGGRDDAMAIFSFGAGAFFVLLQLFFQLSPRQKGLSLGAALMFAATLVGFLAGLPTEGVGALAVLMIIIPIILFWKRLAAGFSKLFFDAPESDSQRILPPVKPPIAWPTAQTPTIADLDTDRIRQSAMFEPASVIEGTTKTLSGKRASEI